VLHLDAATVLLQWAVGGLAFLWVTTRRREVGIGYGWLMRSVYGLMAAGAAALGFAFDTNIVREVSAIGVVLACMVALVVSWQRRKAGVLHQREQQQSRSQRVAEMTGIDRDRQEFDETVPEFPPNLDLLAPSIGLIGLVAAGLDAGSPAWLQLARVVIGAAFLGCVTDAMLLGHWYLTQPGLPRAPLLQLVRHLAIIWPFEVVVLLIPVGMASVWSGTIDDGYGGMLGWFWAACAITTIGLCVVTRAALKERQYSAVMAATGLLYLAILTAFGTDLVARALLS
jgi:heme exporter protein D